MLWILYGSQVYVGCVGCALVLRWFCVDASDTLRRYLRRCVGSLRWLQYLTQRPPMLGKLKNNQNNFISHKLRCIQLIIRTIKKRQKGQGKQKKNKEKTGQEPSGEPGCHKREPFIAPQKIRTIKQGAYAFFCRGRSYSHKFATKMRLNIFEFPLRMYQKFKNSRRSGSKTIIKGEIQQNLIAIPFIHI